MRVVVIEESLFPCSKSFEAGSAGGDGFSSAHTRPSTRGRARVRDARRAKRSRDASAKLVRKKLVRKKRVRKKRVRKKSGRKKRGRKKRGRKKRGRKKRGARSVGARCAGARCAPP
ncbi:hypothetical protein DFH06DRAFT_1318242 [Mycena polygramma]|nr:hypothetical protein DFH06DRAFT_1318242 [Mycena polygramma]